MKRNVDWWAHARSQPSVQEALRVHNLNVAARVVAAVTPVAKAVPVVDVRPVLPLPLSLTVYGGPRTKKNSLQRRAITDKATGKTRILSIPSNAFLRWQAQVQPQMEKAAFGHRPITQRVHVRALIYRDAAYHGDLNGYQQAIGDVLQRAGILDNDELIASWDGTRRRLDRDLPRVEITITPFDED